MRIEVIDTVANPSRILKGGQGELLAVKKIYQGKYLIVVYREMENDGFIITAFITSKIKSLNRRDQLWPK